MHTRTLFAATFLAFLVAVSAAGEIAVIVDVSTGKAANTPNLDRRWYVFQGADAATAAAAVRNLEDEPGTLDAAKKTLKMMEARSDPRVQVEPGDTFAVIVLYTDDQLLPSITFTEERRDSRFVTDLGTLVKLAIAIGTKEIGKAPPTFKIRETTGGTNGTHRRSTITVSVKTNAKSKPKAAEAKAGDAATTAPAETTFDPATMTPDVTTDVALINGPTEHFFISADVPVTKTSEVKYDDTGHAIGTKSTPTSAYAGLNFMLGDVIASTRPRWTDGLMVKALAKLAKRPADSYGVGIGYRFPATMKLFDYRLDNFSVFAAYLRTRTVVSGVKHDSEDVRGGISFNLDKALEWFKKSSK